jgi:hypothetical protein
MLPFPFAEATVFFSDGLFSVGLRKFAAAFGAAPDFLTDLAMGKLLFCKFDKLTSVRIQNTEKTICCVRGACEELSK